MNEGRSGAAAHEKGLDTNLPSETARTSGPPATERIVIAYNAERQLSTSHTQVQMIDVETRGEGCRCSACGDHHHRNATCGRPGYVLTGASSTS